jgi:hypothetical protein
MRKPYMPSNGTEGMLWDERYCIRCVHDAAWRADENTGKPCDVLTNAVAGAPNTITEWTYDADDKSGFPPASAQCCKFKAIEGKEDPDPDQGVMFGGRNT